MHVDISAYSRASLDGPLRGAVSVYTPEVLLVSWMVYSCT